MPACWLHLIPSSWVCRSFYVGKRSSVNNWTNYVCVHACMRERERERGNRWLFTSLSRHGSICLPSHPSLIDLCFYHLASSHAHVCIQTLAHTRLQSPCFVYDIASGITCLSSRGWEAYVRVSLSLQVVWMSDVRFTHVSVCARESLLAYTCARAKTTKQKREASEPTGLSLSSPPFHSLV